MNWHHITNVNDIETIIDRSRVVPCLIFKHSTRCPISSMAKSRLEMSWDFEAEGMDTYFLDLIRFREVSNNIAETFGVEHASPQAILVKDGKAIFDTSHLNIRVEALRAAQV